MQPKKGITIRGSFVSIGKPDSLITFTRNSTVADSVWQELRYEDSSIDSLCIIEYCTIEYGKAALNFINASPSVLHSIVRFNGLLTGTGSYGIQCFGSNAVIKFDSIYENAQYGINITVGSSPTIEYCYIANNNIQNTSPKNQITVTFQGLNQPTIRFNEIHSKKIPLPVRAGGIGLGFPTSTNNANPLIEGNYIHNNAFGVVISGGMSGRILNNKFVDNTRQPDPFLGGSGINVQSSGVTVIAAPIIAGNYVEGNLWGITVQGTAKPNIGDLSNADTTDDGRNVFINNKNRDTIFALYNNTANALKAQNNYWGFSHPDSIAKVIFDHSDIASLGTVTYISYLNVNPLLFVEKSNDVPTLFFLEQNYPNPFNPATSIKFRLNSSDFTTLKVYDILGREVNTLINAELEAGIYRFRFDGSNLPSGVYFYQLLSGNIVEARKMVLTK